MTNKIFKSTLVVALAVLVASLVIITGVLYQYFVDTEEEQLKNDLSLAARATELLGKDYLDSLDSSRYRLTWVGADGTVIFDNQVDSQYLSNHASREEIREALLSGAGSSIRRSDTLTESTIYEAIRLHDGSVLRISISRATVFALILGMFQPIIVVLVFAIILSAWLSHRMAKRVVEPLNNLNLDSPMENHVYEELSPLLHRIHAQHQKIREQMQVLKQKQDEFDQITSNMKEALVLLDSTGRIISINPAAQTLFGASASCVGEDFLTIDRKQNMRMALEEVSTQGHADFRTQKNDRAYQFDLSRIDFGGKTQGIVILAFDITEQVNAEKNRREFTANVSHELKMPLQAIIGSAELMENGIVKEPDIPRFIGHIRKEAARLVFMIDDIISLSLLDEGAEMPYEDVSLREIAQEVCERLANTARLKEVSLEVVGDDGIINGVRRLLYEVVYNLCDNAIKYNRQGGKVKISIVEVDGSLQLNISDTGIGIAPEHQDKIFERFYCVDKSHSKLSGGTGLGLSIVKHAVQYHQGKITVQSEINKGTTISILFANQKH